MKRMRFRSKRDKDKVVKVKFQAGILVNIKSTRDLFLEVKAEGLKYFLTSKANQDALENTFGQLRFMGGAHSHPSAVQIINRIRKLCLVKNIELIVKDSNVEYEDKVIYFSYSVDKNRQLSYS